MPWSNSLLIIGVLLLLIRNHTTCLVGIPRCSGTRDGIKHMDKLKVI